MASDSHKPKGILKNSTSFGEKEEPEHDSKKAMKWDEMNILATYHPADKDYGHMKIDEPSTPYNHDNKSDGEMEDDGLDPDQLADKLESVSKDKKPKVMTPIDDDSSEEDELETSEERSRRKSFEMKRKIHYNEFQAVKLARQLIGNDDEEEGDPTDSSTNPSPGPSK